MSAVSDAESASVVSATIDGRVVAVDTLARLASLARAGDTLQLPVATIVGTCAIETACTLRGAGRDKTVIDASSFPPIRKMAVLLVGADGVRIENLAIRGASIADADGGNAAGIRDTGVEFSVAGVEISACQNGILTGGSHVAIRDCYIHDNGAGGSSRGFTHNLYINGNGSNVFRLDNTDTENCRGGHEVKSRAAHTISFGCHHTTGGEGSAYDIPDGGQLSIANGSMTLPAHAIDRTFLSYATESRKNAAVGQIVTITNEQFHDLTGTGGVILSGDPTATLVLSGCSYSGSRTPQIKGWGMVMGTVARSAFAGRSAPG